MGTRNALVAVSVAALLASSSWAALADSGISGSQGSASVNSSGSQSAGSTVTVTGQGSQAAAATPGGEGLAGQINGGSGFASVWDEYGTSGSSGSFATAGAGTTGFAFAKSGLTTPINPEPPNLPVGASGGSATLYCQLTIKDWTKWWDYSRDTRAAVQRCDCPTSPKIVRLNQSCPAAPNEVFAATAE